MKKENIKNFRNALRVFTLIKLNYRINQGDFDRLINRFLEGDELEFSFTIKLLANDILLMRSLSGGKIDKKIINKVTNLWKQGE